MTLGHYADCAISELRSLTEVTRHHLADHLNDVSGSTLPEAVYLRGESYAGIARGWSSRPEVPRKKEGT